MGSVDDAVSTTVHASALQSDLGLPAFDFPLLPPLPADSARFWISTGFSYGPLVCFLYQALAAASGQSEPPPKNWHVKADTYRCMKASEGT